MNILFWWSIAFIVSGLPMGFLALAPRKVGERIINARYSSLIFLIPALVLTSGLLFFLAQHICWCP